MKIPKWQHELSRYYKRGKLVSYFLNNPAKTCLYGLKVSENIEIGHFFQSRTFFYLNSNLHTSCFSAFSKVFKVLSLLIYCLVFYLLAILHATFRGIEKKKRNRSNSGINELIKYFTQSDNKVTKLKSWTTPASKLFYFLQ